MKIRARIAAAAVLAVAARSGALRADYKHLSGAAYIVLDAPAPHATVDYASPTDALTFRYHLAATKWAKEWRNPGQPISYKPISDVSLLIRCKGGDCPSQGPVYVKNGLSRSDGAYAEAVPASKLADFLSTYHLSPKHEFEWAVSIGAIQTGDSPPHGLPDFWEYWEAFTLEPRTGPPDLALSLDIDNPAVWPKKLLVTDRGGPSKPTFLTVSLQTLNATDAHVKKYCAVVDDRKTHTILEMNHGDARALDVPPLPPSLAQQQAVLHAVAPPGPTATPTKGPLKAALQPTLTYHDPNVHQVVGCQYRIDAKLGTDTNAKDPDKQNNSLSRTIRIDMPMN